nr:hypothetical protein CFP56_16255 [Quercus suber]
MHSGSPRGLSPDSRPFAFSLSLPLDSSYMEKAKTRSMRAKSLGELSLARARLIICRTQKNHPPPFFSSMLYALLAGLSTASMQVRVRYGGACGARRGSHMGGSGDCFWRQIARLRRVEWRKRWEKEARRQQAIIVSL